MVTNNNTRMNLLRSKWQEVYSVMSVYTQNAKPELLYKARRPLEAMNDNALNYRLDNYRNTSKSAFDLSIAQILETAQNIDVTFQMGEKLEAYLDKYRLFDGYKIVNLNDWLINFVGAYRQTDPNSFVVVLPKHNRQVLYPTYDAELPDFNQVTNESLEVTTWLIPYTDIDYVDDYTFRFKAGAWVVNDKGRVEPYYFTLTKDSITLHYPKLENNKLRHEDYAYYNLKPYNLDSYPAYIVGGKAIVWSDNNGELYTYYVADLYGASQVADLETAQLSDLQITEARFTYPEKWVMKKECPSLCEKNIATGFYMNGNDKCGTCGGSGFVMDTTPMGTHVMTDRDRTDNGDIKPPVGFISPDTAILKHSAERVQYYNEWKMRELGLLNQNLTNQSGESKRYDLMQKVTMISSVVTDIYRLYENVISIIAKYINDREEVSITLPSNFDVKNADDLQDELANAKRDGLPYPVIVELTKKFMFSKFGKNELNRKKIDYLALYDKLFVYGIEDLSKAVALFGNSITIADRTKHLMAWQLLDEIENLLDLDFTKIDEIVNKKVAEMIPADGIFGADAFANSLLE